LTRRQRNSPKHGAILQKGGFLLVKSLFSSVSIGFFPSLMLAIVFAALLITLCATSKIAMTILNVFVRIYTATKVLNIHLNMLNVSKSARLFFSIMSCINS
jgi:hypothetical protein